MEDTKIYICKANQPDFDIYAKIIRRDESKICFRRWQKQGTFRISDNTLTEADFFAYYRPATEQEIKDMKVCL